MSDLTATNCGCNNNSCGCNNNRSGFFGGSCIWIILLLIFCGNGNGILGGNCCNDCDNGCGNNNCCEWIIWILLISCFCGNNNGCGCNNCGCNNCGC